MMLRVPAATLSLLFLFCGTWSKPVQKKGPPSPPVVEGGSDQAPVDTGLAYDAYLRQVVEVLESDPEFRKKLETANVSDIKSGKIATHLEFVNHTVRTKLDELKRREITRLQELVRAQIRAKTDPMELQKHRPGHLDLGNPHSFEIKDLEQLIKKTTSDLEELDKQRREEFKEYEMEKKFEEEDKLKHMSESEQQVEKKRLEELKKKHAEHPKLNHPGSKDQFEEVWDKVDHLEDQEFNPRTFFFQHDINGDMEWSIDEVDAVLQLELDKAYDEKNSPEEDDPIERQEEMSRMREHVFKEMDKDRNQRISLEEFLEYTGQDGENEHFKEDDGWKTLDEEDLFTDEEYEQFVNQHHAQPGVIDPPSDDLRFQPEQNHGQQQGQQQFQQPGQQQFQQVGQMPGQVPQGQPPGQFQQQGQQPGQFQQVQQQGQFQQVQQQGQQPGQFQQVQQQGQQPGQFQQVQQPGQVPQQAQQPGQIPQQGQAQMNMNQVSQEEAQKLQAQLNEVKAKLAEQQNVQNQVPAS